MGIPKINLCRSVGAVIISSIQKIDREDAANRELLARSSTSDLFDGLYEAAEIHENPNHFLNDVRYYCTSEQELPEGGRQPILEFYK